MGYKSLILLALVSQLGFSSQQEKGASQALQDHNFFYGQAQGRFIPTFQDSRNGFFPAIGTRSSGSGSGSALPGSYQDRQIFVANSNQGASSPSFFQFANFPVTTRRPDIFEISPRPFSFTDDGFQLPFTKGPSSSLRSPDFFQPSTAFGGSATNRQAFGQSEETPFRGSSGGSDQLNVQLQLPSRGRVSSSGERERERERQSSRVKNDPYTSQQREESNNVRQAINRNSGSRFRTTAVAKPTTEATPKPTKRNNASAERGSIRTPRPTRGPIRDLVPLTEPTLQQIHTVNISHNGSSKQRDEDDDYFNETSNNQKNDRPLEDESKFYSSPKNNVVEKDQREEVDDLESSNENNKEVEAHTVILTDNFFLPSGGEQPKKEEEPEYEYEYEYVEDTEEPPPEVKPETSTASSVKEEVTPKEELGKEDAEEPSEIPDTEIPDVVPETEPTAVLTSKGVSSTETPVEGTKDEQEEEPGNTTESWVVVASVQTSRSVSGARFLPFPQVKQEEKKAPITELEVLLKSSEEKSQERDTDEATQEPVLETTTVETTTTPKPTTTSESINDKLDSIQSELSSGVLSGQFPVLKEMTTEETSKAPPVFIRKFSPKPKSSSVAPTAPEAPSTTTTTTTTTEAPPSSTESQKKSKFVVQEDLSGLLPADFKPRYTGYKNKKTSTATPSTAATPEVKVRNVNNTRSFFKNDATAQDLDTSDIKSKITFLDDDISKFLPKDYTTAKPSKVEVVDDVSKFLPPGYKPPSEAPVKLLDDVSKFLPPGFKAPASEKPLGVLPLDDISKFLPPGFKQETSTKPTAVVEDISKFLPPGYRFKPKKESKKEEPKVQEEPPKEEEAEEDDKLSGILKKIQFKEVADLLPSDFKPEPPQEEEEEEPSRGFAPVFPTRPGGNKEAGLPVYKKSKGPPPPKIEIKRGPPTRATTEFTGWPTVSTTPISIEKLLQQSGGMKIDLASLFNSAAGASDVPSFIPTQPDSPFTNPTTTTTTTTTTTVRPTEPGVCQSECDLAGTIRLVDGIRWKPELLDHNTDEWKNLAREVKQELNDVFIKSDKLRRWYKTMRIDSFSKGSVLVDYFVELNDIPDSVNTLTIKKLFHDALTPAPPPVVNDTAAQGSAVPQIKETFLLGKFVVDPISTDFIVQHKPALPTGPEEAEDFLPQWAIAVIVMSFVSLLFVILFGVAVLVNRQKAAKKKGPATLTAAMLNELNKNHMGGIENYGNEDLYNVDDGWGDEKEPPYVKQEYKSKRLNGSVHGSSATNIYDSWRSTRGPADYQYQDHYDPYSYNKSTHSRDYMMHEPPAMYPYSKQYDPYSKFDPYRNYEKHDHHRHSRRFYKDYDPTF